jgi:FSR family fosmidomycin resistance protein-like MFS transporter
MKNMIGGNSRYSRIAFLLALYGVELLDELIFGLQGAVLPYLKTDLALNYTEIGLLLTIPGLVGIVGEPFIGLLADTRHRRALVIVGIVATALGLLLVGAGQSFWIILLAFCILYVASGAYVSLAQATLIDRDPARAEQTMARWTLLGSIGVTIAPLLVTALFYLGYSWRGLYLSLAGVSGIYTALLLRQRFDSHAGAEKRASPRAMLCDLLAALRNRELLRWVIVTELADLMLDKLLEVTGLYFHDVVGVDLGAASGAVAVLTMAGLIGGALLVPALEKIDGLRVLRVSAVIVLAAYIALLLVPNMWLKYALLALVSFSTSGWYPILRGRTYAVLPGQSGMIVAITSLGNVSSVFVPLIVGRVADVLGLQSAMWLLALGPIALLIGLPRSANSANEK